jgi:hypothetical protein
LNPVHKKKSLIQNVADAGPNSPLGGALIEHLSHQGIVLEAQGTGISRNVVAHIIARGLLDLLGVGFLALRIRTLPPRSWPEEQENHGQKENPEESKWYSSHLIYLLVLPSRFVNSTDLV